MTNENINEEEKTSQIKKKTYSATFKSKVVESAQRFGTTYTSRKFDVPASNIIRWSAKKKKGDDFEDNRQKNPFDTNLEEELLKYFHQIRDNHLQVNGLLKAIQDFTLQTDD